MLCLAWLANAMAQYVMQLTLLVTALRIAVELISLTLLLISLISLQGTCVRSARAGTRSGLPVECQCKCWGR